MQNIRNIGVKSLFAIILLLFAAMMTLLPLQTPAVCLADGFSVEGKAAYLTDAATGTVIYSKNENERLPIASMVKIMTALVTLEAVEEGKLSLDEDVPVSEEAASMGGSQVFLDAGTTHKAGDLLKSVIIASANDSCVALAERVGGSVSGFVGIMNKRAKELGMNNTNFVNCTGLPAAESFSSAKDVGTMFGQLIKHPKYFEYAGIWLEDYEHPSGRKTCMTNTNKLIRFYNGCDGGKTGFTSEAKFCLAATAQREGMRVIAVVIGGESSKGRFGAVTGMFNHAFGNYSNNVLVKHGDEIENDVRVIGGKTSGVKLTPGRDITAFMARSDSSEYEVKYELPEEIKAPLKTGQAVGKAYLSKNGEVIAEYDVVAAEDVGRANIFDIIKRIGGKW